jgi:hypothetical protein
MHVLATLAPRARSDPSHFRSSSEALSLGLGFALGTALVVAWLGLRVPVLVSAVLPPLAAGTFWQQRQARASSLFLANSSAATTSLLEARGLHNRLDQLGDNAAANAMWCSRWQGLVQQMESIRSLAARCVELDPQAAVPLLVFMEGLLDLIEPVGRMMQQLDRHAPSPLSGSYVLVHRRIEELHIHLNRDIRRLQDVHDSALEQSMLNSGAAIDFQQLLTKPS